MMEQNKDGLFVDGAFQAHSGSSLPFQINGDVLTDDGLKTLAALIAARFPFGEVEGIPRGGLRLAEILRPYAKKGPKLLVDDVLTTGASMEAAREATSVRGVVLFARGSFPNWIKPIFTLDEFWR